jgi:hypothetical protein
MMPFWQFLHLMVMGGWGDSIGSDIDSIATLGGIHTAISCQSPDFLKKFI